MDAVRDHGCVKCTKKYGQKKCRINYTDIAHGVLIDGKECQIISR